MEKLLLQIIQKIQLQKQEKGKVPESVLIKEIWSELFQQMEVELELMCEDGKLTKNASINYVMFKINK